MTWQWQLLADLTGRPGDVSLYGPAWAPQRNVPATADLNTFTVPGVHRITTPDVQTILNLPAGMVSASIFENLQTGTGTTTWWAQRITQHGNSPRMWWRTTRDLVGGWNDWEEVLTDGGKITELHVFVAVGQSNMSGRGLPSGGSRDPENPRIMQYGAVRRTLENATVPLDMHDTATGISPATTFARTYLKSQPTNVGVLIIPAAHGSTGFTTTASTLTWTPNAASASQYDLPALAVAQTNEAIAAAKSAGYVVSLEGILWHQGENNTTMSTTSYASNLDNLIAYFRTQLGNSKLPFVVGQMSPDGIDANAGRSNIDAAHQGTPSRVPYTGFAAAIRGGYNTGDTTHMSRLGIEFVGRNYAGALSAAKISADLQPRTGALESRAGALETNQWAKAVDNVKTTLDDYTTPGKYQVTKSGVTNRPFAASGDLEVFAVGSIVTQKWTTTETIPRIFTRTRNGSTWTAWSNATWASGAISGSADLNDYQTPGSYTAPNSGTANKPVTASGNVVVYAVGAIVTQIYLTLESRQREFVRQFVGGAWTAWDYLTWYQGLLPSGTDFDTLTRPAEHGVTFTTHPHQPIAKAGSMTVKASSGDVVQEYTPVGDNPDVYRRRKPSGSAWTAWVIRAFSPSSTPGGATLGGANDPTRSNLSAWTPTLTAASSGDIITEFNADRTVGFNGNHSGGRLKETRDNGVSWTDLKVFADPFTWVKQLDNGELIACTKVDPDPRDLWLSSGYGTGTVTWTKVLSAHTAYATFNVSWGFSTYKNIVLMAEYGPKLPTWNGNTVTENARYVYMSLDSGKTWTTIFDLNNYLLNTQSRSNVTGQHVHGVTWDPYWDRIWVTFGDDSNGILYSDDLGVTWQTAFYGSTTLAPYQVVGIIAMPKAILFGTDVAPNGVQRIDRAEGKRSGTYPIQQAYTIPGDDGTTRTNLCQAIHRVNREGDDGPVLFGFSAETNPAPSFIVATYDGFNFTLLWQDTVSQAAGLGIRTIAGPSLTGQLVVGSNDGRVSNMWSKITGPAPIY